MNDSLKITNNYNNTKKKITPKPFDPFDMQHFSILHQINLTQK